MKRKQKSRVKSPKKRASGSGRAAAVRKAAPTKETCTVSNAIEKETGPAPSTLPEPKPRPKYKLVQTQNLRAGDLVTGSDREDIMFPPSGHRVARCETTKEGGWVTAVWWNSNPNPEYWNPLYGWYVLQEEKNNGTTEERPL